MKELRLFLQTAILSVLVCAPALCQGSTAELPWCAAAIPQERSAPLYPPIAKAANITGTIIGRLSLSEQGNVTGFEVVSGPEMLRHTVVSEVQKWKFQPQSSEPRSCEILVIVNFTIGQDTDPNPTKPPTNGIRFWVNASRLVLYTTNYNKAGE
jgi:TonB family protein